MVRFTLNKKGAAVVCLWALIPGAAAAPFIFWQSVDAGIVFAAFWLGLCLGWLPARLQSFEGSVTLGEVRMSSGLLFKVSRRVPTRWWTFPLKNMQAASPTSIKVTTAPVSPAPTWNRSCQ